MNLSKKLKQDHECGDFGNALAGYSEQAERLERAAEIYAAERPNGEVRGASRPAGEASSAEGATSTVMLGVKEK